MSSIGRIFGLPTPVLQDTTFTSGISMLNELESGTLDNYSQLQQIAEDNYKNHNDTNGESGADGHQNVISDSLNGYCIREFSIFLSEIDPGKVWAELSPRVNEKGELCYVCPTCCAKEK